MTEKQFTVEDIEDMIYQLGDEVNRIESVVELHDFLAECNKEDWKLLLERFEG